MKDIFRWQRNSLAKIPTWSRSRKYRLRLSLPVVSGNKLEKYFQPWMDQLNANDGVWGNSGGLNTLGPVLCVDDH